MLIQAKPITDRVIRATMSDVHICPELTENQREELRQLLDEYSDIFSYLPGATELAEHKIQLDK